ncbi:MAG: ABC transporter substrate-binding protein [Spirochaetales bacterium]|nr:ABC transporter substrate-binding protein [Spirochaetales bacterium]
MRRKLGITVMAVMLFLLASFPVFSNPASEVRLGVLKGPTGIGASYLLSQNDNGETKNRYSVTVLAEATDMIAQVAAGQIDIAAIPTNAAASLYNKTNGGVRVAALNTAGVLYILENGKTVSTVADLKGKTIYTVGQGSNPEYVLRYILSENGIDPDKDVEIVFMDSAELTTRAAAGGIGICMLPVPAVTTVLIKNPDTRIALDMTEEWNRIGNGSILTMGCVVVRTDFLKEHPAEVRFFLEDYEKSIVFVQDNIDEAAQLCAQYEIVPSAAVARKAIPDCNLIFTAGADSIRSALEGYLKVLYDSNPKAVGGKMPGEDFYSIGF